MLNVTLKKLLQRFLEKLALLFARHVAGQDIVPSDQYLIIQE